MNTLKESLKNISIINNQIISLSPYRRPVPPGKRYQYQIRVGEYPQVKLYLCSDFVYNDGIEAKAHAERELIRRGIDPMKANIYLNRRNKVEAQTKP